MVPSSSSKRLNSISGVLPGAASILPPSVMRMRSRECCVPEFAVKVTLLPEMSSLPLSGNAPSEATRRSPLTVVVPEKVLVPARVVVPPIVRLTAFSPSSTMFASMVDPPPRTINSKSPVAPAVSSPFVSLPALTAPDSTFNRLPPRSKLSKSIAATVVLELSTSLLRTATLSDATASSIATDRSCSGTMCPVSLVVAKPDRNVKKGITSPAVCEKLFICND